MNDDSFDFCDEDETAEERLCAPWNILVVDDDLEVHQTTNITLNKVIINNRPLNIIHSYSGEEAIDFMKHDLDIDLILLDMVMETADAGWTVAKWLREDAGHPVTPMILLRTGQPGYLSTNDLKQSKYINDVLEKTKATRLALINMMSAMLPRYVN